MLLRGFAKGVPTKHLTDEMDLAYPSVLKRRHRIQEAVGQRERTQLPGEARETSYPIQRLKPTRCIKTRGKIRFALGPPRRRANKQRGRGTCENNRPPVVGMVGRETG